MPSSLPPITLSSQTLVRENQYSSDHSCFNKTDPLENIRGLSPIVALFIGQSHGNKLQKLSQPNPQEYLVGLRLGKTSHLQLDARR
jgi:hypothetical protein